MELCLTQEVVVSRTRDRVYSFSNGGEGEAVSAEDLSRRVGYFSTSLVPRVTSIVVCVSSSNIYITGTTYVSK